MHLHKEQFHAGKTALSCVKLALAEVLYRPPRNCSSQYYQTRMLIHHLAQTPVHRHSRTAACFPACATVTVLLRKKVQRCSKWCCITSRLWLHYCGYFTDADFGRRNRNPWEMHFPIMLPRWDTSAFLQHQHFYGGGGRFPNQPDVGLCTTVRLSGHNILTKALWRNCGRHKQWVDSTHDVLV